MLNAFNKKHTIPEVSNRTLSVFINRGYTDIDELTYTLPDDVVIDLLPQGTEIKTVFGSYAISIRKVDKKLIYRRKLVLNNGTYPADKNADFADFISSVSSYDQVKAIFKTELAKN